MPTEASRLRIILSEAEVTTVQRCEGMELRSWRAPAYASTPICSSSANASRSERCCFSSASLMRGRCSRMVSAARRPCVFLRSKLAVSRCRSAHLVQHRSSPEVDLTSTPSMSNRMPPTSISTMEEEAGTVFKMAGMVRAYQRRTAVHRDALRPTAWLAGQRFRRGPTRRAGASICLQAWSLGGAAFWRGQASVRHGRGDDLEK